MQENRSSQLCIITDRIREHVSDTIQLQDNHHHIYGQDLDGKYPLIYSSIAHFKE